MSQEQIADIAPLQPERDAFELPRDVVWMNAAQMSAQHRSVREAGDAALRRKSQPWRSPPSSFFSEIERARALFAELINASPDDIAIAPSCSYGVATAARNLELGRNESIVVAAEQFPSNVYAWRREAAEADARIVTAGRAGDGGLTEPLLAAIDETTRIVATAPVHWSDATPIDLVAISRRCREVGAALTLDLTQSLGAVPFDVREVDPDFAVCPCYKWLLGPYSFGFLYVAPRRQDGRPLEESWMARADAENFAGLVDYTDAYAAGARRFDMGEKANFNLAPMAIAALELLLAWEPRRIAATLSAVNDRIALALAERGFAPPPKNLRSPHYFGLELPDRAPADLAARLAAEQVYISVRGGKIRVSPHLWIDAEDEARFLEAVNRHIK